LWVPCAAQAFETQAMHLVVVAALQQISWQNKMLGSLVATG